MNQYQSPKRSNFGAANSIMGQHTPVNPWNQYLVPGQAPSPVRFLKVAESKNPFTTFPKSSLGTPEIFQFRNNRKEINLQKLLFSGVKESRNKLHSSSKKQKLEGPVKKSDAQKGWKDAFGLNPKKLWIPSPAREPKEGFANLKKGSNRMKLRSSEIQYECDFLGESVNGGMGQRFKAGALAVPSLNKVFPSEMMKALEPKCVFSPKREKQPLIKLEDCVKPKKLFETRSSRAGKGEQDMLGNMQDFFEKSLSKILEATPQNAKNNQNVGMLFFNAINSIRTDSKGKQAFGNLPNSRNSSERKRFQSKKCNFGAGRGYSQDRPSGTNGRLDGLGAQQVAQTVEFGLPGEEETSEEQPTGGPDSADSPESHFALEPTVELIERFEEPLEAIHQALEGNAEEEVHQPDQEHQDQH